jgi:HlyD family secretion protein
MKKKVLLFSAVLIVAVIIAMLIFKPFGKKEAAVTFETVKVERGNITNTVTATGTIEAVKSVAVGTQVSGIIDKVYVDFNDVVKKGQLLAEIDKKSLQNQLEQSKASVDQARAQLNLQEATFNRMKALYEKKLIAQSDYDQALFNFDNARAALTSANANYDRNKVNLNYATIYSPIDGVVLNRAIEAGQTVAASFNTPTLFTIVNDLTQMQVQTSVDEADIGKVRNGQRVEFTVDAYPDLKFNGSVTEVRLNPVTTNNVVTYVVILDAPNPDKKLMPGMTASATIYVDEKENTLIVSGKALRFTPSAAYMQKVFAGKTTGRKFNGRQAGTSAGQGTSQVAAGQAISGSNPSEGTLPQGMSSFGTGFDPKDGSKMVWMKDEKGSIHPKKVKLGIDNGTSVEILSGLKEGDEVIIAMSGDGSVTSKAKQNNGPRGPFPF